MSDGIVFYIPSVYETKCYNCGKLIETRYWNYQRCLIPTGEESHTRGGLGSWAETKYIVLSDGRLIITNDLWYEERVEELPTDRSYLTGQIYDGTKAEQHIYSIYDRKKIDEQAFKYAGQRL